MSNPHLTISMPADIDAFALRPGIPPRRMTDEEFDGFVAQNPDIPVEMTKDGELLIMSPVTAKGGRRNFLLTSRLGAWAEAEGSGVGFDSSTCFTLPNRAKRSPDAAWITRARWEALTEEEKDKFAAICPDFVVELRSKSDKLRPLQQKMEEYVENGAQLGWLIDPIENRVHVYRGAGKEVLEHPDELSGEPVLHNFVLKLDGILD